MTHDGSRPTDPTASTPDWDAIARTLAGESPADEAARVQRWLDAHPEEKAFVARLSSSAELSGAADVDVEAALARVHLRMGAETAAPQLSVTRGGRWRREYTFGAMGLLAAAAAFALFVARPSASGPTVTTPPKAHTFATSAARR